MPLPALTADRTLRPSGPDARGLARSRARGVLVAEPFDLLACTRAMNLGLRHCYLRVDNRDPLGGSFSLSFDPAGGNGLEHEPNAPGTRCTYMATLTDQQALDLRTAWNRSVAANPNYNLLNNNCCTKVIGALNRIGLSAPADINDANLGYH